jgi:hypothetical protein
MDFQYPGQLFALHFAYGMGFAICMHFAGTFYGQIIRWVERLGGE